MNISNHFSLMHIITAQFWEPIFLNLNISCDVTTQGSSLEAQVISPRKLTNFSPTLTQLWNIFKTLFQGASSLQAPYYSIAPLVRDW